MQKWFFLHFLSGILRQDLKGEKCSVVRNRAGLEVWDQAVSWYSQSCSQKILQQPECCFPLRCEHLVTDIARTNLALLSALGNEREW